MVDIQTVLNESSQLVKAQDFLGALTHIEAACGRNPESRELKIQKGRILCWFQREPEALELLEAAWGAEGADELWTILARHGLSRRAMEERLGSSDGQTSVLLDRLRALRPLEDAPPAAIRLSAVMIVRNEAAHLERCLRSLQGEVDEIVVVDTGSTDDTLAIAARFGAVIGRFDWCDDFAAARNAALELATGDWALWIDADEVVDPVSWGPIRQGLVRPHFGGFFLRIVNFTDEAEMNTYTHAPVRLFRRTPDVRFTGRIHEQVTPSLDALGWPLAHLDGATLWHYGYKPSAMEAGKKLERTLNLLLRQVDEEPNDAFHWFNLANAYSVANRHEDVISAGMRCLVLLEPGNNYASLAHQLVASAYNAQGAFDSSWDIFERCEALGCTTLLNQFEAAHALYGLRRYDEALGMVDACLAADWPNTMTGDRGIKTHKALVLKAQILAELGRLAKAMEAVDRALIANAQFGLAWLAKGQILDKLGKPDEASEAFAEGMRDPAFAWQCRRAAGLSAARWQRHDAAAEWLSSAWRERPQAKDVWAAWAQSLEELGDAAACLEAYQAYSLYHEPNADVLVNWGRALEQMGRADEAIAKFLAASDASPMDPNARFNLGDAYYRRGQYLEAAEAYRAALQWDTANPQGWFVLGNALAQIGLLDGAVMAYQRTLSLDPTHTQAHHNLSMVRAA